MVEIQKDVFWKAAIITVIVFGMGIWLGTFLESNRISDIRDQYKKVEVDWADAKIQSSYLRLLDKKFCSEAIEQNILFADRVYQEGLKIDRFETYNKLHKKQELRYEKQRYTLFKLEFWFNSIFLKEKCNATYTNLVYFYEDEASFTLKPKQETQAMILKEIKEKYGDQVMLVPIPLNLDISSAEMIKNVYNITIAPTILINEKIKLEDLHSFEEIEQNIQNAKQ